MSLPSFFSRHFHFPIPRLTTIMRVMLAQLAVSVLIMPDRLWADSVDKVNKLGGECHSGKQKACAELAKIAVDDKDARVRSAAVDKLTDQALLANIAVIDRDPSVRSVAVNKLTDQALLVKVALEDNDAKVRSGAAQKVTDQSLLAKIALEAPDATVRNAVVKRVTDQASLAKIAVEASDAVGRSTAVQRVIDPALLAKIAAQDKEAGVRSAAVMKLIQDGDVEHLKALLKENPDLVFSKDVSGLTPLHWAAAKGHKDLVNLLLASKAEIDAKSNDGFTPLYAVAFAGRKDIVELLLANKADVNAKANDGLTPLHAAAAASHKDIVELLLHNKADVNAKSNDGLTPLHAAALAGRKDIVELLLANKADANARTSNGLTPLHVAALAGHKGVAELLIANKADVNAKADNYFGFTPLHVAAFKGHKDVVELLLANKADVNVQAKNGKTALQLAQLGRHADVVEVLAPQGGAEVLVIAEPKILNFVSSLRSDIVFFTSREHPISRLADITTDSEVGANCEFGNWPPGSGASAFDLMKLKQMITGGSADTLQMICNGNFGNLFQKFPQLRLFVTRAIPGELGVGSIEGTGGGIRVRFLADDNSSGAPARSARQEDHQDAAELPLQPGGQDVSAPTRPTAAESARGGNVSTQTQDSADKELEGCICGFDEAKSTVKVVPWNQGARVWDSENTKMFVYQNQTIIAGESKATVAELKSGKAVKTYHFTGMSASGITGTPFEIKSLPECVGRRTTLHWVDDKGTAVATTIELPYLFAGESMAAGVGSQGARVIGSDDCPCGLRR